MEILSTGEKIKRARIYKGLTLRELCEDKISVSKMSCIENNKIKPEPWILEYISKKLDASFEYLQKDVKDHLNENYEIIKENINSDKIIEEINNNLEYAESSKYYDTAIKLIHLLSKKYLEQKNEIELKNIQCKYYELYEKVCTKENQALYFADLADYLQLIKQYEQSANYYKSVRLLLMKCKKEEQMSFDKNVVICEMIYNEALCYIKTSQYKKSYDVLINNENYIGPVNDRKLKFKCYAVLAFLCYKMQESAYKNYKEKAKLCYEEDKIFEAKLYEEFACIKLEEGDKKGAFEYIKTGMSIFPKEEKEEYINYLFEICYFLIKHKQMDKCSEIIKEAVDKAILIQNSRLIEEAYYISGLAAIEEKNQISAEMNMSISLDYLKKVGSKEELYDRYLILGDMYYKFGNIKDSLKYFNQALIISKYI